MRRVLVPAGVLVLAAIAGGAVAGMPTAVADDVQVDVLVVAPSSDETATTPPPRSSPTTMPTTAPTTTPTTTSSTTSVSPSAGRIVVANAAGVSGAAAAVARRLKDDDYTDVVVANATQIRSTSTVLYNEGFAGPARALAALLGVRDVAPRTFGAVTELDEPGNVWLLVGRDLG